MGNSEDQFSAKFITAFKHFLYSFFIYFIFIIPFELWKKATLRLAAQKDEGVLNISKINSRWPFLSFLKTFTLDFLFDGIIFIAYIAGFIFAVTIWIIDGVFSSFSYTMVLVYFSPIAFSLTRDIIQIAILPFKKFMSWVSKPAQFMDLEIKNK